MTKEEVIKALIAGELGDFGDFMEEARKQKKSAETAAREEELEKARKGLVNALKHWIIVLDPSLKTELLSKDSTISDELYKYIMDLEKAITKKPSKNDKSKTKYADWYDWFTGRGIF